MADHEQRMVEHKQRMAALRAQAEEAEAASAEASEGPAEQSEELIAQAKMGIPKFKARMKNKQFDIIVYVDYHGECELMDAKNPGDKIETIESLFLDKKDPPRVSIMRSGDYGSVSYQGSVDEIITQALPVIMRINNTKEGVFTGLQQMLRYNKIQEHHTISEKPTRAEQQQDTQYVESLGWEFAIDGTKYYNTYYSQDEDYKSVTVVYTSRGPYNIGDQIKPPLSGGRSTLSLVLMDLIDRGYKNIGIIEHTCHVVLREDLKGRSALTRRLVVLSGRELRKQGIMGGTKRTKKYKRRRHKRSQKK
jgi:hypothetical protein